MSISTDKKPKGKKTNDQGVDDENLKALENQAIDPAINASADTSEHWLSDAETLRRAAENPTETQILAPEGAAMDTTNASFKSDDKSRVAQGKEMSARREDRESSMSSLSSRGPKAQPNAS